jgi:hypothetical protein
VEEKTIEEASLKMEPEVATKIVCHCRDAALRDRLIPKILDRAEDASEARECLEVILVDSIQGSPDDAAWAIAKVLAHAGKAGLDPVDLMIAFASRLEAVSRSAGESPFGSAEELVEALDRIATGKEEEPRGASAEMQPREPTDEELAAILPDDQRRALRDLEMALDALRRAGQESPFLEGQRKIFLSQARRLWEEKRAAAPS